MIKSNSTSFKEIREYLNTVPVIETHEHYTGITIPIDDVFDHLMIGYHDSDFLSSTFKIENELLKVKNKDLSFDERYNAFKGIYDKTCNTAYSKGFIIGLNKCHGISEITKESVFDLSEKIKYRNHDFYLNLMNKYKIKAKIVDVTEIDEFLNIIYGKNKNYTKFCKFSFPLPVLHDIHSHSDISWITNWTNNIIKTIDDYTENCEILIKKAVDFGVVCFKDQTAYRRSIHYKYPSKAEAEIIFNKIISNPRDVFGDDEVRVLDDWLFHSLLGFAKKYNLPVQIHTGHMAGIRNDLVKTNASNLTNTLELHSDIAFDLFHGNWPYMGDYLFLGKNYPNAYLDLCWAQSIDPLYCIELMKRVILTVPHVKLMAYGGDTKNIENAIGYLELARDNVAFALSEMIDCDWLTMDKAKQIAIDWFYNNPNNLFNLGFDEVKV